MRGFLSDDNLHDRFNDFISLEDPLSLDEEFELLGMGIDLSWEPAANPGFEIVEHPDGIDPEVNDSRVSYSNVVEFKRANNA